MRILHLDDQCEKANWIPRQLTSHLWRQFTSELTDYPGLEEDDTESRFVITARTPRKLFTIDYVIVESTEAFWSELSDPNNLQGIVLDQWVGANRNAGSSVFRELEAHHKTLAKRSILFTAYPQEACQQLGWQLPHDQLIIKPPTQEVVLEWVTSKLFPEGRLVENGS